MTDTKPQFQEAQRTPSRVNTKTNTSEHEISKLPQRRDEEKILKEVREKTTLYTEEQIYSQHISCQKICKQEDNEVTSLVC